MNLYKRVLSRGLAVALVFIGAALLDRQVIDARTDDTMDTPTETTAEQSVLPAADEVPADPSSDDAVGGQVTITGEDSTHTIAPSENPKAPDARVEIPDLEPVENSSDDQSTPFTYDEAKQLGVTSEKEGDTYKEPVVRAGYDNAQEALRDMYEDIVSGINTRRSESVYRKWQKYAASILARTDRLSTGLELNNRCRLSWYDKLYRDPITSVFYAEEFTRQLYEDIASGTNGIIRGLRQARVKMDLSPATFAEPFLYAPQTPQQAVLGVGVALTKAAELHSQALSLLKPEEIRYVTSESFSIFCAQTHYGHTVSAVNQAKNVIDLMEKVNGAAMYDAAETLLPLTSPRFIEVLKKIEPGMFEEVTVSGQVCQRVSTPAGNIIIGGPEDNTWDLDAIEDLVCLIDLGGNDTYKEGSCNPKRPILLVLDLGEGDDTFEGTKAGIQGGAILGVSILYNEKGDDFYRARDIAQGGAIGGIGILIDMDGNDRYLGFKRVQGCAMEGFGAIIDRGGDDQYRAALLAQGLGNPRGFGLLFDQSGDDYYYVGGYYEDSYPEHPGYDGWGQGIGAGVRGVACGGIGVLLEGEGNDTYEYDYFGHGGGYWMALGFLRDFSGDDVRVGATLKSYTNNARTQERWQRFSNGFGCHYALGFLFDDAGNDRYNGTIMGLGMAWDLSAGFLVDFSGDDTYEATGGLTQGTGAEGSLGFLLDYRGEDRYLGRGQGYASGGITYHQAYDCGGNFSFVVDHGGADQYGCGAKNNMMSQRGTPQGFIIDRPTDEELAAAGEEDTEEKQTRHAARRPIPDNGTPNTVDYSLEQTQRSFSSARGSQSNGWGPTPPFWGMMGGRR